MFELVAKFIQKARKNELFSPFLRFFAYLALFPKYVYDCGVAKKI